MKSSRISKPVVRSVLEKYLDDTLAHRIFWEMVEQDENDSRNMIGMTVQEYLDRFDPADLSIVWADDTPGFGRRGQSVYGDCRNSIICYIETSAHAVKLFVFDKPLTSDLPYVNAAIKEYNRRHPEEV